MQCPKCKSGRLSDEMIMGGSSSSERTQSAMVREYAKKCYACGYMSSNTPQTIKPMPEKPADLETRKATGKEGGTHRASKLIRQIVWHNIEAITDARRKGLTYTAIANALTEDGYKITHFSLQHHFEAICQDRSLHV